MSQPTELCTVTAGGQTIWETVEVHRSAAEVINHCLLTVSEISTGGTSLSNLKLAPGTNPRGLGGEPLYGAGTPNGLS